MKRRGGGGPKKSFIRVTSKSIMVRSEPTRSGVVLSALQEGQIQQTFETRNMEGADWFKVNSGWICSRDSAGFICTEPSSEDQANRFWTVEFTNRKRLSAAVANLITRSYGLDEARKRAKQLNTLSKGWIKASKPLINLPDINVEALLISLQASTNLRPAEIFEFLKIASSYQSDPRKSLLSMAQEIEEKMMLRPSQWVKEDMGVLTTSDVTQRNNRFIMSAGQGDMQAFEQFLADGQELTALHSDLKYTALHSSADFGAEEPLKWLIRTKVNLDLRDGRLGRTPLHYAAASGRSNIIRLLLDGGADRTLVDYKGQLAYQIADEHGYYEAKELLKMVPPEIHRITISSTTCNEISLRWHAPSLQEHLHSKIIEFGILHEPIDTKRDGSSQFHRVSESMITIPNLNPATGHAFSIMSRSIAGWSKQSSKVIHFTSPTRPDPSVGVELLRVSINGIFITWFGAPYDNGARVDYYEIDLRPMTDNDEDRGVDADEHEEERIKGREETYEQRMVAKAAHKAQIDAMKSQDRLRRLIKHKGVHKLEKTIIGLQPGQLYKVKVRAHNELGFSDWSYTLDNVQPKDGVFVREFCDEYADIEWFTPLLQDEVMDRKVTAFELQMCCPTGPLLTDINVFDPHKHGEKNIQAVYDYVTLSDTIIEPRFKVTGLQSGKRYQFRVRPQINKTWVPWSLGIVSEIISTPCDRPGFAFDVKGVKIEEKTAKMTAQGNVIESNWLLDATDSNLAIQWTNGNSNGSSIDGCELYAASYRGHKERDLGAAALEHEPIELEDLKTEGENSLDDEDIYRLKWTNITADGHLVNATTFKAGGLKHGHTYIFRVRQRNEYGWSQLSAASEPLETFAISKPPWPLLNYPSAYYLTLTCQPIDAYATFSTIDYELQCTICPNAAIRDKTEALIWVECDFRKHEPAAAEFPYHKDCMTLEAYKKEIEMNVRGLKSGLACPNCQFQSQKEERATHVLCEECGTIFCYICGKVEIVEKAVDSSAAQLDGGGTVEFVLVEQLSPNTSYLFRLRFRTAVGWSPWSDPSPEIRTITL